MLATISWLRLF